MRIAILGRGLLGHRLAEAIEGSIVVDADITNLQSLNNIFGALCPDAVVNAAGKTGRPNVDWCESHKEETYRSNVVGPLNVAEAANKVGAYMLHLGSGCIFYGQSPSPEGWREDDIANPSSYYSKTKYAADLALSGLPHVGIARLRMPVDVEPGPRNLITKLLGYKKIVEADNSITIVKDFVEVASQLVARRAPGIFHVTNPGPVRHSHLLGLCKEYMNCNLDYELIDESSLLSRGLVLAQRSNCILASSRLKEYGIQMRPAKDALKECVMEYSNILRERNAR